MNHRILDASVFLVRGKREGVERTSVLHVAWVSLGTGSLSEVSLEVSLKCVIEIFFQPISCNNVSRQDRFEVSQAQMPQQERALELET